MFKLSLLTSMTKKRKCFLLLWLLCLAFCLFLCSPCPKHASVLWRASPWLLLYELHTLLWQMCPLPWFQILFLIFSAPAYLRVTPSLLSHYHHHASDLSRFTTRIRGKIKTQLSWDKFIKSNASHILVSAL